MFSDRSSRRETKILGFCAVFSTTDGDKEKLRREYFLPSRSLAHPAVYFFNAVPFLYRRRIIQFKSACVLGGRALARTH